MNVVRHAMSAAWVLVLLGFVGEVAANSTPPGYLNKTRMYRNNRAGSTANVNAGVSRSTSTFWSVVDTNATQVVTVYETATIGTNLTTSVQVKNNQSLSLTATTTRATMIRSMTLTANYTARNPAGTPGVTTVGSTISTFSVAKDSGTPVVVKTAAAGAVGVTWSPNLVVNVTFDVSASDSSMIPHLLAGPNPLTFSVLPQTADVFNTYTNQACTGTWIFNIQNTTGDDNFYLSGFSVNVTGDAQSISVSNGSGPKDITPRGVSERAPYLTISNGIRTYLEPRNVSER